MRVLLLIVLVISALCTNGESSNKERFKARLCRKCNGKPCRVELKKPRPIRECLCDPPCLNEAQCIKSVCQCPVGFTGTDCGKPEQNSSCSSMDCENGGHCVALADGGARCSCLAKYTGDLCQTPVDDPQKWCNQECQKQNRVCKPLLHEGKLISYQCLESGECRVRHGCKNGYCLPNNTNNCICKECWHGPLCDYHCCRNCLNGGRCITINDEERCDCQASPIFYTGDYCEKIREEATPKPKEVLSPQYKYILGASGAALALLLIMVAVIPYVLWKKRVVWILKIVHKFQSPIEVGEKEYHAFVSYSGSGEGEKLSADENFVLNKLMKKLEGEYGFSLCLHYRDFVPGVPIAENIIDAVESSHRTILVLSRRFMQSEWCRFEYREAQRQMLMRRHRIIPIILDDLNTAEISDKNLLTILKAVTYIVWPGEDCDNKKQQHFWKKLVYSMPKKCGKRLESFPSTSTESSVVEIQAGDLKE